MKIVPLLLATTFAAAIGLGTVPAMAQSPNDNGMQSGQMNEGMQSGQMNGSNESQQNGWGRDHDWSGNRNWQQNNEQGNGWMGRHHRWMMGGGPGWMGHGWWHHHRHEARGARFIFKHGRAFADIQCPANQNLNNCVNAATTLLSRIANIKQQESSQMNSGNRGPTTNGSGFNGQGFNGTNGSGVNGINGSSGPNLNEGNGSNPNGPNGAGIGNTNGSDLNNGSGSTVNGGTNGSGASTNGSGIPATGPGINGQSSNGSGVNHITIPSQNGSDSSDRGMSTNR